MTLPSESVQVPLGPQVPLPYKAAPELKNMTEVLGPVLPAEPVADGAKRGAVRGMACGAGVRRSENGCIDRVDCGRRCSATIATARPTRPHLRWRGRAR